MSEKLFPAIDDTEKTHGAAYQRGLEDGEGVTGMPMLPSRRADLSEKIRRDSGLCTSIAHDDHMNALRAKYIIDTYIEWAFGETLGDYEMQLTTRSGNEPWRRVHRAPYDFGCYCYRLKKYDELDE
jgi:hypothetical protein